MFMVLVMALGIVFGAQACAYCGFRTKHKN